jgi:predicted negative regulator of RcsB-dependent stress response
MADDIVLTEEEQVEQIKQWLKKNGPSIFLGIGLGLALIFGFNYYTKTKDNSTKQASAIYEEIITAEDPIKLVEEKIAVFKSDYSKTPYAAKVVLLNAKRLAESGDINNAIIELSWVLENTKEELIEHTARLRQAQLFIENGDLSDAEKVLNSENIEGFESNYQEMRGDIAAKNKDFKRAMELYSDALKNAVGNRYNTYLQLKINKMTSLSKGQ